MLDELYRPLVIQVLEEAHNVGIEYPVHFLSLDAHRQSVERLMRAATGTEPVREAHEVDLVNLIEDRHHGLLDYLVLYSRDAQRTFRPVGLRYIDSP